jgi:predicted RNase H-like HicB family nuclease
MSKSTLVKEKNSIKITIQIVLFQEDNMWVAYCPALELSSYGDDQQDAKTAFREALDIFLKETDRKSTLERYLLKLGWQLQIKPKPVYNQPYFSLQDNKKLFVKNPEIYHEKVAIPIA